MCYSYKQQQDNISTDTERRAGLSATTEPLVTDRHTGPMTLPGR